MSTKTVFSGMGMMATALVIFFVLTPLSIAAPVIQNQQIIDITDTSASVAWLTNENSTSVVNYGVGNFAQVQQNPALVRNHTISLQGLQRNITHNVSITSCNSTGNCTRFFTSFIPLRDTEAGGINVTIPAFVNRRAIDITGSTEPFSEVYLYVNNFNTPVRVLGRSDTGAAGRIDFRNVILQDQNSIRILTKDRANNLNEKLFDVRVDTEAPILVLQPTPSAVGQGNVSLKGTVNEPVTLKIFVRSAKETPSPTKNIRNFRNQSIGQNYVTLAWDDVDDADFSHYILKRSDVGPIALAHPDSYTSYTDIIVDAGKSYTYTLSYMNRFGVESNETSPITVQLPTAGIITGLRPQRVDVLKDFSKATQESNASGSFGTSVMLRNLDGAYTIKIEAVDQAGNSITLQRQVSLDTKPPTIQILSPPSGALIYENYANEIEIKGITEPGATVHLYVGRTPFNSTLAGDISGIMNEIQNIPASSLNAECDAPVRTINLCTTNADFTTTADAQGNFVFEEVDATAIFSGSMSFNQVSVDQFSSAQPGLTTDRSTRLLVLATDNVNKPVGKTLDLRIGNCWSGNVSWDAIPLTEYQTPTLISTERLAENTESIYFYFNYTYLGRGNPNTAKVKTVSLQKACGNSELLDPRYNISCRIMPAGAQSLALNPEGTVSYTAMKLARIDGMDRWVGQDWKDFFKSFNDEMTFPMRLTIQYEHEVDGRKILETQSTCQEVSYVMDRGRIDFKEVLPDWLLYDFVDLLNASLATIRNVQNEINKVTPYVMIGCGSSVAAHFGAKVWRNWQELFMEKKFLAEQLTTKIAQTTAPELSKTINSFFTLPQQDQEYCSALMEGFLKSPKYSKPFRFSYLNDKDFQRCFPDVWGSWELEANAYKASRWSCDRMFGHSTPAAWTKGKSDSELSAKIELGKNCLSEGNIKGNSQRRMRCKDVIQQTTFKGVSTGSYNDEDYCLVVSIGTDKGLYKIGKEEDAESRMHVLTRLNEQAKLAGTFYAIRASAKPTEDYYILPSHQSCVEACGGSTTSTDAIVDADGKPFSLGAAGKDGVQSTGQCITANACRTLNAKVAKGENAYFGKKDSPNSFQIRSTYAQGFTSDCFGGKKVEPNMQLPSAKAIGVDPAERIECCCIRGTSGPPPSPYYAVGDGYLDEVHAIYQSQTGNMPGSPSGQGFSYSAQAHDAESEQGTCASGAYCPIKWSYRYQTIKFKALGMDKRDHTGYNPYRYIEGRDQPACFGAENAWFKKENTLIIDPAQQYFSNIQCVNIGGVQTRLQELSNILSFMQNCLISVRTTKTTNTQACKELFSQYVCDGLWNVIQEFIHFGTPCASSDIDLLGKKSPESNDFLDTARLGLKGITNALSEQQSSFLSEYKNTKLNEMFGGGQEAIARKVCLAAFGYDWDISFKSLLDASYTQPFATLVQPLTANRDFLTINPKTATATYEYRGAWLINPGCLLSNYRVDLACIGRDALDAQASTSPFGSAFGGTFANGANCEVQRSPDGVNCPCLNTGEKTRPFFTDNKRYNQNELVDKAYHEVISEPFRYDHLKITINVDPKVDPKIRDNCYPTGSRGVFYYPITDRTARDVASCRIDTGSGGYVCSSGVDFFSKNGFASLSNIRIIDTPAEKFTEAITGQRLGVKADVMKAGNDKCLRVSLRGGITIDQVVEIKFNGTSQAPEMVLMDPVAINTPNTQGVTQGIIAFDIAKEGAQSNTKTVTISVLMTKESVSGFFDPNEDYVCIETGSQTCDANSRINFGSGVVRSNNGLASITPSSGSVLVEKEGARIRLSNFKFASVASGVQTPMAKGAKITQAVTAFTQQGETQQIVEMEIGLYNKRDNANAFVFNPITDCNFNDAAVGQSGEKQIRKFSFTVRNVGSVEQALRPSLTQFTLSPTPVNPTETSSITLKLTKHQSVQLGTPTYAMDIGGGESVVAPVKEFVRGGEEGQSIVYSGQINPGEVVRAGSYKLYIDVPYFTPDVLDVPKYHRITQDVRVLCNQNPVGECRPITVTQLATIDPPAKTCWGGEVCKKVG